MKRFPKQDISLVLMDNGNPSRRHTAAYGLPWTFVILILLSIQTLYAQPVAINGALSVSGNKIVNKNGVAVSFAGNSLFWSNDNWGGEKYYTAGVVSWLRNDWNSAIVRAAMGVEDAGGYLSNKTGNKNKVKTVVDAAIANDMYVIIDWHTHNAEANVSEAVNFFTEMAQTYGDKPNVIYEVYNEPINSSWSGSIKPYAQTVINAIRAVDPDNLIIVGTRFYSAYVNEAADDPISGSNIAYTIHFYAASHKQDYMDRCTYALNKGVALFATEWGAVNADGSGNVDVTWTNNWMNFLKQNNISHCNWSINDKNEGASSLNWGASTSGNWTSSDLTWSGSVVRDILRNYNYGTLTDGVSFNSAPIITSSKLSYPIKLDHTAIGNRALVVSMLDSTGAVLASATTTASGSGTKTLTLNLASLPRLGTKYRYKAEIKATANATTALDTKTISNVSIVPQEPIAVIEAESYGVMSGVQKEACSEGGQNVGYLDATDWMSYSNVTIPTTGKYTVYFRAAAASSVGKIRLEKDNGATLLGAVNIPVTGGWQTWNTVSQVMDLSAGTYNMGLAVETAGYNLNFFAIAPYVSKSNPTIFITSTNAGFTGSTINLTATSSSTGAITWSVVAGNGNLAGNTLTLGAAGTVTVQASIAADANFNSGSAQQVITILPKIVPSITFADVNKTYGDAPFTNSASSNSTGTFTYSIVSGNNFAAINSSTGTLTILGAGSVVLQVSQAATSTYALATKTALLAIGKKTLTATADGKTRGYGSANPALTISYAGFAYGETATVLDVAPTATTSATLSSNVGTYAIIPSGGSDNNYSFSYTNGTMTITSINPTLTITSTTAGQAGSTINLTANSNSSGTVTWSIVSGNGSISGSTLTLLSPSAVTVQASIGATTNYTSASAQQTIAITPKSTPTITFADVVKTFGDAAFTVSASSNSAGALTYSITSGNSFASINATSGEVTILGAGTVTLQVSQAANGTFAATTKTATLTINKATRTINITSANAAQAGTNVTLTGTTSPTGGSITWSIQSQNGTSASLSGATLTAGAAAGSLVVKADVAADANYNAASATQTITISSLTTPTITFADVVKTYGDAAFTVSASSNSAGALTYSITSGNSFASINATSGEVTILGSGTVTLQVSQAANGTYAATTKTATLTINKATRTINITSANAAQAGTNVTLTGTTSPTGGSITWSIQSQNGTSASLSGATLTAGAAAGSLVVKADVAADANYNAASATQTITISSLTTPTITFADVVKTYGAAAFTVSASSNSAGALTYSITSGNSFASINATSGEVTILAAGTVTLQVSQAASGTYAATTKTAMLTINKATRSINITSAILGNVGGQILLSASVSPSASAQWSLINGSGNASLSGEVLDLLSAGSVTVTAMVPADANFEAATTSQVITISPVTALATDLLGKSMVVTVAPNPFESEATLFIGLPTDAPISVEVFTALGSYMTTLVDNNVLRAGNHTYTLGDWSAGTYVVKVACNNSVQYVRVVKR